MNATKRLAHDTCFAVEQTNQQFTQFLTLGRIIEATTSNLGTEEHVDELRGTYRFLTQLPCFTRTLISTCTIDQASSKIRRHPALPGRSSSQSSEYNHAPCGWHGKLPLSWTGSAPVTQSWPEGVSSSVGERNTSFMKDIWHLSKRISFEEFFLLKISNKLHYDHS